MTRRGFAPASSLRPSGNSLEVSTAPSRPSVLATRTTHAQSSARSLPMLPVRRRDDRDRRPRLDGNRVCAERLLVAGWSAALRCDHLGEIPHAAAPPALGCLDPLAAVDGDHRQPGRCRKWRHGRGLRRLDGIRGLDLGCIGGQRGWRSGSGSGTVPKARSPLAWWSERYGDASAAIRSVGSCESVGTAGPALHPRTSIATSTIATSGRIEPPHMHRASSRGNLTMWRPVS